MAQQIEDYLSPPLLHGSGKQRLARIVQSVAIAVLLTFAVNLPIGIANRNREAVMALLVATPAIAAALGLAWQGRTSTAGFVMALGLLVMVTVIATLSQGLHDAVIIAYPGILIVASLTLNKRAFVLLVGLTMAAVGWLGLGALCNLYVPLAQSASYLTEMSVILPVLMITAFSAYMLTNYLQQAVNERQRAEQALRDSQAMLQLIFNHAFDGISVYEEFPEQGARRLIDCNARYAEMAGRSKEEYRVGALHLHRLARPEKPAHYHWRLHRFFAERPAEQ